MWKRRVKEYEQAFAASVEELQAIHGQQRQQVQDVLQSKLRAPARPSKVCVYVCVLLSVCVCLSC